MRNAKCAREVEAARAAATGMVPEELREHAAHCAACRETLQVAAALRRLAEASRPGPLPAAEELWWRAEVVRRLVQRPGRESAAVRVARWSEATGLLVAVAGLLVLLVSWMPDLLRSLLASQALRRLLSGEAVWITAIVLPLLALALSGLLLRETEG